ncbi:MAG: ABC transporter permease [Verrucomicrobiales bacterium]
MVWKLSLAYFRERPLRLVLTSLATAAAAVMVLWVVSGYDALMNTFDNYSEEALGRYSLSVAPISNFSQYAPGAIPATAEKFVPAEAVADLLADPAVLAADPIWAIRVPIRPFVEDGEVKQLGRLPDLRILASDSPEPAFDLVAGRWLELSDGTPREEVVMSVEGAEAYQVEVGDFLLLGPKGEGRKVEIVGLVDSPRVSGWTATVAKQQMHTPGMGGLFLSRAFGEVLTGREAETSFVGLVIKEGTDFTKFRYGWSPKLSGYATPVQFQEAHDIEEALDESASAENVAMQARMATAVSMLAALFIIFSTLNMGISERIRQLAILRAVVLTRAQVGGLVLIEGLLFGAIGFVIGVGAGKVLMLLAAKSAPDLLDSGAVMGKYSLLLAALCAFGGGIFASLLPAWRAMRVKPIEAMAPEQGKSGKGFSPLALVAGVAFLLVYPLLAQGVRHGDDAPFVFLMMFGLSCLALGLILLMPAIVRLTDHFLSPLLARLLGVPAPLLKSQLSGNLSRTMTTAIALTVGLGLFVGIQVWGHTMLGAFMPGAWAPDSLLAFKPGGIPRETATELADIDGIKRGFPIVVEQPRLREDLTKSASHATVTRQDSVVLLGIAPEALEGEEAFLEFEWVAGDRASALKAVREGCGCVVPDHFLRDTGLAVGDHFGLVPPEEAERTVDYVIAGAVRLPGWHWQTKPTGFRTRTHRAAALIFANYDQVAADFHFVRASHYWFDVAAGADLKKITENAQSLYADELGEPVSIGDADNDRPYLIHMPIEQIKGMVDHHARAWLWAMSRLPLVILVITTIGVLNALLAAVRSRRWEFGILRAIGHSRGTLVRLVMAEGLLIGVVAMVVSLIFGILAGWSGAGISRYVSFFGGMDPTLVVPWAAILPGLGAVLGLTALAAVWPALSIGRVKPLELLQQGRSL